MVSGEAAINFVGSGPHVRVTDEMLEDFLKKHVDSQQKKAKILLKHIFITVEKRTHFVVS